MYLDLPLATAERDLSVCPMRTAREDLKKAIAKIGAFVDTLK
ncbi:MAG: hypothetical protein ACLR23_16835 [Clostridia bacterium]